MAHRRPASRVDAVTASMDVTLCSSMTMMHGVAAG